MAANSSPRRSADLEGLRAAHEQLRRHLGVASVTSAYVEALEQEIATLLIVLERIATSPSYQGQQIAEAFFEQEAGKP